MKKKGSIDLRIIKTDKALDDSLYYLLRRNSFNSLSVLRICEQAGITRATFYTRHTDKYNLLKNWLNKMCREYRIENHSEDSINQFLQGNKAIIKNILFNADWETLEIFFDAIPLFLFEADSKSAKDIVFSKFLAGGLGYYIWWQSQNDFSLTKLNIQHIVKILDIYKNSKPQE